MIIDLLSYGAFFLTMALSYAVICLGLNVQWGQTGLFNVGVAGFVAVGAYTSALLTTPFIADRFGGFGLPIVIGWLGGGIGAALLSAVLGALTLRLRADYLAIATFGAAVVIQLVLLNSVGITGGPSVLGSFRVPLVTSPETPTSLVSSTSRSWPCWLL
ncbi:branched-chain amino acid ABC transporter permease [Sulfitobacter porphyrae]|uniref:Branched-chain amino acid ABC transporter permease n=1 Tax=Sulfitobacter porphyrae TaxID=1246864 RepID=A0ABW2B9J0_9RHOB